MQLLTVCESSLCFFLRWDSQVITDSRVLARLGIFWLHSRSAVEYTSFTPNYPMFDSIAFHSLFQALCLYLLRLCFYFLSFLPASFSLLPLYDSVFFFFFLFPSRCSYSSAPLHHHPSFSTVLGLVQNFIVFLDINFISSLQLPLLRFHAKQIQISAVQIFYIVSYPNIHIPVCPSPHINCYSIPANSASIEAVFLQSYSGCLSQISLPFPFNFLLPVSFFSNFYPPMSASHFALSCFPLFSHTPSDVFLSFSLWSSCCEGSFACALVLIQ